MDGLFSNGDYLETHSAIESIAKALEKFPTHNIYNLRDNTPKSPIKHISIDRINSNDEILSRNVASVVIANMKDEKQVSVGRLQVISFIQAKENEHIGVYMNNMNLLFNENQFPNNRYSSKNSHEQLKTMKRSYL